MFLTVPTRWPLAVLLLTAALAHAGDAAFEIRAGDRVLLIGDTLFEREGAQAELESRLYRRWAPRAFTVRNLAFSGDRPDGASRASFDQLPAGMARIKEQLALVKPTVAILGYGMAASLDDLTLRSGDPSLNPDQARYGDSYPVTRFRQDLTTLMDAITAANGGAAVRFVLVAPIRHEDLRKSKPGLPDPAAHQALLDTYAVALRELAKERGALFVDTPALLPAGVPLTDNGIHPTPAGLARWAEAVSGALGWNAAGEATLAPAALKDLSTALRRKNDLFFHRWRPANQTYLFGFRKHEQGRNGAEMAQFDQLIGEVETTIAALVAGKPTAALPIKPAIAPAATPTAMPAFTMGEGVEAALWAENPLISKPVHLAWDARGRLWTATTPLYPQIEPGAVASDKVYVLEDSDRDGKADKSTVFSDQLLIPTGVAPVDRPDGKAEAYVGASTELLLLTDNDGDGKGDGPADTRRVVLSGFGTEDTHHTVHTLYWGHDGRLYFSQSVYIHSHLETPWGMVRLNAGGVFAYDTRTERVEVHSKGLWNTWGHRMDAEGQSFLTDGAGGNGISWAFPGAVFNPSEGSRGTMASISPGSYPKFCGLELIHSPLFPADWQGQAITCDFRAHRIVRMAIKPVEGKAGYVTADQPDLMRTPEANFRPIDAKLGPDGALYLADWTNPVINHGEVDFRDARRDKDHGRIWRVGMKDGKPLAWKPVHGRSITELCDALLSTSAWERDSARRVLASRLDRESIPALGTWAKAKGTPAAQLAAAFVLRSAGRNVEALNAVDKAGNPALSARWRGIDGDWNALPVLAKDASPRVRVEAMRALARRQQGMDAGLLEAIGNAPADDAHYAFAVQITMDTFGKQWVAEIVDGKYPLAGREAAVVRGLLALPSDKAAPAAAKLLAAAPDLVQAPWPALVGHAGDQAALVRLFAALPGSLDAASLTNALGACAAAAGRGVGAPTDVGSLAGLLGHQSADVRKAAIQLAGKWKRSELAGRLGEAAADSAVTGEAIAALQTIGGADAVRELGTLIEGGKDANVRRTALAALAKVDGGAALERAWPLLAKVGDENEATGLWRALWQGNGVIDRALKAGLPKDLPAHAISAGLSSAREMGKRGDKLAELFTAAQPQQPATPVAAPTSAGEWVELARKGDAAKGERLYFSAGTTCVQCHAIGGAGGKMGPDLSSLGASAPLDYIIESVLVPGAKVKEGYHAVTFKLKDGSTVAGVPFEENEREWKIRVPGAEQSVLKADVVSKEVGASLMPPALLGALPVEDQANLYAFLAALGKPGKWDASDGKIARQLRVSGDQDAAVAGKLPATAPTVFTLVDGRALPGHWRQALAAIPGDGLVFAVARFQLATDAMVEIKADGAWHPWLDGLPMDMGLKEVALKAGEHWVTMRIKRDGIPRELRLTISQGRFVVP